VKLRTFEKDPHRTKKACFFCRTGFEDGDAYRNTIQPFDLMSRRHPLSSIRAFRIETRLMKRIAPGALMTRRHQPAGYASQATYFFFLATLRVFFAVFFTALFAFFAFFAFLAMLPSD
jgi:hypothetical protein